MIIGQRGSATQADFFCSNPFNHSRLTDLTWQEKTYPLTEKNRVVERRWTGFDRKRLNLCQKWCNLALAWVFERVWRAKQAENRKKTVKTAWLNSWTAFERSDIPFKIGMDRKKLGHDKPCFERKRCLFHSRSANFWPRDISIGTMLEPISWRRTRVETWTKHGSLCPLVCHHIH